MCGDSVMCGRVCVSVLTRLIGQKMIKLWQWEKCVRDV